MRRKKEHGHVNHERWLVSYADFITLLFAFFVVLFASSQADKNKQAQVAAAMQMAFTPLGSFDAHAKTPPLEPAPSSSAVTKPAALALPFPQAGRVTPAEEKMESKLNRMVRQAGTKLPEGSITTRVTPELSPASRQPPRERAARASRSGAGCTRSTRRARSTTARSCRGSPPARPGPNR